jgi:predicted nucleic acid-binding protein
LQNAKTGIVGEALLVYIDTSAAVKLVHPELHSKELSQWVRGRMDVEFVSSVLIEVELPRAIRRRDSMGLGRVGEILDGIGVVALSSVVVTQAAGYDEPALRSLDAIHLATAEHVANAASKEFIGFLAYDIRLLDAARNIGLPLLSPGLL